MEPLIAAATDELEELRSDMREGLAGRTTATLNWAPHPGGNTIAGLLAHMLESAQFLLRVGHGETPTRDRDSQFFAEIESIPGLPEEEQEKLLKKYKLKRISVST